MIQKMIATAPNEAVRTYMHASALGSDPHGKVLINSGDGIGLV
jgi:hypothetical protein